MGCTTEKPRGPTKCRTLIEGFGPNRTSTIVDSIYEMIARVQGTSRNFDREPLGKCLRVDF
ncbi:MAG: hypothetical protein CBC35_05370 [Planctomycetes bacterium TMED75]|nr:hypothetical protein [Planctomycetaceae bacterium]OUU93583.1 MAG: hypothetical protein CBC35_05370 [Planctomycetes bacterium TMED75]